jgi:hypothetical protein
VIQSINATLAGRYDKYSFAGRDDGKFTYNGGVEWRPVQQLLLRGTYATSFRAPDMNYIFKARGTGYYASTTDYYRCAKAGQPVARLRVRQLLAGCGLRADRQQGSAFGEGPLEWPGYRVVA